MKTALKWTAGWLVCCAALVAGFEGLETKTYLDVGGVPTICYGETKGVTLGDTATPEECRQMLAARLERDFGPGVDRCLTHPVPPQRKAAYVSLAYNIGTEGFCRSSIARKENAGDVRGACNAILLYNKVRSSHGLVISRGLDNRRRAENKICLETA